MLANGHNAGSRAAKLPEPRPMASAIALADHGRLDLGEPVERHLSAMNASCLSCLRIADLIGPIPTMPAIW